ncbi:MAG: cytochrome c biogenesis protein CcsA [Alteromonadaceae bacterium]|nr:cytochrome c biogenesis protein CcsA [Alteromonadaceae bacterium]
MATLFALLAIAAYLFSAISVTGRFFHNQGPNRMLALSVAALAIVCHSLFLGDVILAAQNGQNLSITNVLSLVAWLITLSMLISSSLLPNTILLPVVFCFSAFTVLASLLIPVQHIMQVAMHPGLIIHISLSLFAYGTLVIGFLYAVQMSYITHQLKHKGAGLLHSSLPPLMLVESILFKLILLGTILLVVAQLSGFVFLDNMFGRGYVHKTVLSIAGLLVFVLLLIGQKLWGWRGKQVITLTVVGVILLSLAYFGSRFVSEIIL